MATASWSMRNVAIAIDLTAAARPQAAIGCAFRCRSATSTSASRAKVNSLALHTVCKEAACPNVAECWGAGTATIMILGDTCTRGCRFCNVKTGNPRGEVDWLEPVRVAEAVRDLGWKYLVLTAVDRDDLADGGALIFANTVRAIHERVPGRAVEDLSGDYRGDLTRARHRDGCQARRLRAQSRNGARGSRRRCATSAPGYDQSLAVLAHAKQPRSGTLHEDVAHAGLRRSATSEIETAMDDARCAGVDIFTMGQYLQPSKKHLPVVEFVTPRAVRAPRERSRQAKGFHQVVSSPLSRSSYHAEQAFPARVIRVLARARSRTTRRNSP